MPLVSAVKFCIWSQASASLTLCLTGLITTAGNSSDVVSILNKCVRPHRSAVKKQKSEVIAKESVVTSE